MHEKGIVQVYSDPERIQVRNADDGIEPGVTEGNPGKEADNIAEPQTGATETSSSFSPRTT